MTTQLNSYLGFRDTARQAMEFYQSVFGGELTMSTFGDFQASDDPAEKEKIMHASLSTDAGLVLMAADRPSSMGYTAGDAHSLSLTGDDDAALRGYWDKLSDGGRVGVPLEKAPWGDTFGMCTDRFGVNWMVNIAAS